MLVQSLLLALLLSGPGECSREVSLLGPSAGEVIALARATGREAEVSVSGMAFGPGVLATTVTAFEFIVLDASGPGAVGPTYGLLIPGDTVLVVPWDVDSACKPLVWPGEHLAEAGVEMVLRTSVVRAQHGRRVIDQYSDFWPYPIRPAYADQVQGEGPGIPEAHLPARDVFNLLSRAPRGDSSVPRINQLAQLERAYRTGPSDLLKRFPGPQILNAARQWAER